MSEDRLAELIDRERTRPTPDLTAQIMSRLDNPAPATPPTFGWRVLTTVFLMAAILGTVLAGFPARGGDTAYADLAVEAVEAQTGIDRYDALVEIDEYGWNPDVTVRTYSGALSFEAPGRLRFEVADTTESDGWLPNNVAFLLTDSTMWSRGRAGCPLAEQATCAFADPVETHTIDQNPFSGRLSARYLVFPASTFLFSTDPADQPDDTVVSRRDDAIVVSGPTGLFDELLATIFQAGDWRPLSAADRVAVTLDPDTLVVRGIRITAGEGPSRSRFALQTGYTDDPDTLLYDIRFSPTDPDTAMSNFAQEAPSVTNSGGFDDLPADTLPASHPEPSEPPANLRPWRTGTNDDVTVTSWTNGASWLTISSTTQWSADRLFGRFGQLVHPTEGRNGTLYLSPNGKRVGLHGTGAASNLNVEVAGNLGPDQLIAIAESLDVASTLVPDGWWQSTASAELPDWMLRPETLTSTRIDDGVATMLVAGPGQSGYQVIAEPESELSPPQTPDVTAVTVRGVTGRFTPQRYAIEWIEDDVRYEVLGAGRSAAQLIALAEGLGR